MSETKLRSKELKNLGTWIHEIANWAWIGIRNVLPYFFWIGILFGVYLYLDSISACVERDIRWIGLIFQIIGFVLVARQLTDIRTIFRKPSFASRVVNYLKSFPSRHVKKINLEAHARAGSLTAEARLSVKPGPNTSLEGRVEILETAVESIEEDLRKAKQALRSIRMENQESLEELRQETKDEVGKVRELIDDAFVGGIHLEWIGTICFLMGAVLATIAPELSAWLGYEGKCS